MRIPFRALHVLPSHACWTAACAPSVLAEPAITRVPVLDAIGIEYAFDLQLTQGLYVVLLSYALLRWARQRLLAFVRERREEG